jgi:steroid delta-isomerase-like uncharacterized protein
MMSVESTREVIMKYFNADHSDTSMLADDVVFTVMATGEEHRTPEGVQEMLKYLYQIAFDATAETRNLIVSDGHAVLESTFIGKHIGEFAGIPASNKDVSVPLCVVYDVENGQIKQGRVYFLMASLMGQLGAK